MKEKDRDEFEVSIEILNETKSFIEKSLEDLKRDIDPAHTPVLVIGDTGEGKSALINVLISNPDVEYKKVGKFGNKKVAIDYTGSKGPKVGIGESVTSLPQLWKSDIKEDVSYWDCPGFGDTREASEEDKVMHDAVNTYLIDALLKSYEAVKVMLVISSDTLAGARVGKAKNVIKKVASYFQDLEAFKKTFSLIITKIQDDGVKEFKSDLADLKLEFDNHKAQDLYNYLCEEESKVGFFREVVDAKKSELDRIEIAELLSKISFLAKPKLKLEEIVSYKSKMRLNDTVNEMNVRVSDAFKDLSIKVLYYVKSLIYNGKTYASVKLKLDEIKSYIIKATEAKEEKEFVQSLDPLLKATDQKFDSKELQNFIGLTEFFKEFARSIKISINDWSKPISNISNKIDFLFEIKTDPKIPHNTLVIKSPLFGIEKLKEFFRSKYTTVQEMENDKIVVSECDVLADVFYCDADFKAPGLNLAVIANTWITHEPHSIDLSGLDGKGY